MDRAHSDRLPPNVVLTMQVKCWGGGIGFPGAEVTGASECLNGSLVYVPALLAMAIVGGLMAERKHPARPTSSGPR